MARKLTEVPAAPAAASGDSVTLLQNGAVRQLDVAKLPVSEAAAAAAESKLDATAVRQIVSSMLPTQISQLGGHFPAANIEWPDGRSIVQVIQAMQQQLAGTGASAPEITTDPTISGTAAVGNTLTATPGAVTEGVGGSHTTRWQWYVVDTLGQVAIAGATSSTLVVISAYTGKRLLVTQIAVDSTGLPSDSRSSSATAAVTATLPSNTVQPAITPIGEEAVGTALMCSTDTWSNASGAVFTYQWLLGGVAISGATSNTYTPILGQEGGSITCRVTATTAQGSASADSSNTITVAGAPALTLTAPALPATVTVGVAATITNSTPSGGTPTLSLTRFYVDSATTPYAQIPTNPAVYTPEEDGNSFLLLAAGLSSLVGHTIYCDQLWTLNGQTISSPKSAGRVVQAPAATLAARIDSASVSGTQGTAITSVRPITGTGGTTPYTYAISPALPSGLTFNASTGFISGTPTVSSAQTTYTVTVTDAVGATASATFQASMVASGVTPLALALAASPANDYVIEAPTDSDSTGYGTKHYSNNSSVVSSLSNLATIQRGGATRFGPTTKNSAPAILHRVVSGDPTRNSGHRSELDYSQFTFANAEHVWFAQAVLLDPDCNPATSGGASDHFLLQQTHQENTSPAPIGNPFSLTYVGGGSSQGINWIVTYQGNDYELYRTPIVTGAWLRLITHYRSGFAASGHNPIMEAWVAQGAGDYTKLSVLSPWSANQQFGDPLSTPGSGNDWAKSGIYKWTTGAYGSSPTRTFWSSGLRAGKGVNLFNEAAASLSNYAL